MEYYNYMVMAIGLIFDVLLIIFVIVSCLLIYSLLLLSVETKTFDFAVMRLVGLTARGFVGLIITQACFFVLPSVILGFLLSIPTIFGVYQLLFDPAVSQGASYMPSPWSIFRALFIGIFIPLISSIIPIRRALSKNLNDGLNI